jgi:hypothetical protein
MTRKTMVSLVVAAAALLPLRALAADLGSEIVTAETHAGLAAQASDIAGVHMHLHHALNCIVGPSGNGFDAKEMNPCANSGAGALVDETDVSKKPILEKAEASAEAGIAATDVEAARKDATDTAATLKSLK